MFSSCNSSVDTTTTQYTLQRSLYGYCPDDFLKIADLFSDADDQLFSRILHTLGHVLKPLLPNHTQHHYNLRERSHNFELINKNAHVNDRHFLSDNCSKTCTNNFFLIFIVSLFIVTNYAFYCYLHSVNVLLNEYCIVLY